MWLQAVCVCVCVCRILNYGLVWFGTGGYMWLQAVCVCVGF